MNARFIFVCLTILYIGSCVQAPNFKGDDYSFIKSSHTIVSVNGEGVDPKYTMDLMVGETTLVVLYRTYRHSYYCLFKWTSESRTAYEITDQENQYPLTLYRWKRENDLWASRLDPIDPVKCSEENEFIKSSTS